MTDYTEHLNAAVRARKKLTDELHSLWILGMAARNTESSTVLWSYDEATTQLKARMGDVLSQEAKTDALSTIIKTMSPGSNKQEELYCGHLLQNLGLCLYGVKPQDEDLGELYRTCEDIVQGKIKPVPQFDT